MDIGVVDERLGFLREDYAKTVEEARGIVKAGLAERTDEVRRAMIAMGEVTIAIGSSGLQMYRQAVK